MLALSTSWKSKNIDNNKNLLQSVERFDVQGVELEYRIKAPVLKQIKKQIRQSDLSVVSLHNYCPVPSILKTETDGGDLFLLYHPDRAERLNAIKCSTKTIEHANDLESRIVILHCGQVKMPHETEKILY